MKHMEQITRQWLAGLLAFAMVFAMLPTVARAATFDGAASGTGSEAEPYMIETADQLKALSTFVNSGNDTTGMYFKLANDINLHGSDDNPWTPIGGRYDFNGSFDGDNHTISELYIKEEQMYSGLFGSTESDSVIKNLTVSGSITSPDQTYIGGVVGYSAGYILNCFNACDISCGSTIGGIVGYCSDGQIINCVNMGEITAGDGTVGGIVGKIGTSASAKISGCINKGTVNSTGIQSGGIVGYFGSGDIENCTNSGSVIGQNTVGGIAGANTSGTISKCKNYGSISGNNVVGGISGCWGSPTHCYNEGTISGDNLVGGIIGQGQQEIISNCYNAGSIEALGSGIGGIAGVLIIGEFNNCLNTGNITGSGSEVTELRASGVGGIAGAYVGYSQFPDDAMANCSNIGTVSGAANTGAIVGSYTLSSGSYASGTTTNCYYLNTAGVSDSNKGNGVEEKTDKEFATGEVAWLLQEGQTDQAWGQVLGTGNLELTSDPEKRVYKVTFQVDGDTRDERYANPSGLTALPDDPVKAGSRFSKWTTERDGGGDVFTIGSQVNEDITVYAAWKLNFDGSGTEEDPYLIPDKATLEILQSYVNSGTDCAGLYFEQTADIDLLEEPWDPIGVNMHTAFDGSFDGGGHTIKGLLINTNSMFQGLFGHADIDSTIKNLTVEGSVSGGDYTGGIAGESFGVIENCCNKATISGTRMVGGIVGNAPSGEIRNCCNIGAVTASSFTVGGIAGYATVLMTNCYNTGNITGIGPAGGLVGTAKGTLTIVNCYNTGTVVTSATDQPTGGLVGDSKSTISNSYNTGVVTNTAGGPIGGIAGTATSVDNTYYLDTACSESGGGTPKTADEFNSGEVAWLLQNGQSTPETQVWGQTVGTGYPELTNAPAKKVYKVTFATAKKPNYAVEYANPDGVKKLPSPPAMEEGLVFDHWSTTNSTTGGETFTENTPVTKDITVYAIGRRAIGGESDPIPLTAQYGTGRTENLSKYVAFESGDSTEGQFTFEITDGNDTLEATIDRDTLTIPATADVGDYTLTVTAKEASPQYALMSFGPFGSDPVKLTVKVSITPAPSTVSVTVSENPTYGSDITLTATITADGLDADLIGGTITFKIGEDALSDPVTIENGTAALKIEGTNTALQKKLFGESGTGTLTAVYSGSSNITSSTDATTITVAKKALEYTVSAEDKTYDGTTAVTVTLTPTNLVGDDVVTLTATGNVGKPDPGEYKTVDLTDITSSGADAKYYSVEKSKTGVELAAPVHINEKPADNAPLQGTVTQSGEPVPGATVTLKQGDETKGSTTTGADGSYSFPDADPGVYTVVVETPDDKTLTSMATVTEGDQTEKDLEVPDENINSKLDANGSDSPVLAADGLNDAALEAAESSSPNTSVTVTMTVERETEATAPNAEEIQAEAESRSLDYMDIRLTKTTEETGKAPVSEPVPEVSKPITVVLRFDFTGKENIVVYRYHNGKVDTLTEVPNANDEFIELNETDGIITLHVKHFSTYAIGYSSKDIAITKYPITVEATGHGSVTPSSTYTFSGDTVILTVTPESGYHLDSLTVLNKDGKTVTTTKTGNNTYTFTMPAGNVTVTATFTKEEPVRYVVTISASDNGTVKASPTTAAAGDTVTLTVTPDAGYKIEFITVKDDNGEEITTKANEDGTYTFTMPAGDVTVTATFTLKQTPTPPAPQRYPIYIPSENISGRGSVVADRTDAAKGDTVTLTVSPERGYYLYSLKVLDQYGNPVALTRTGRNTYTFTQPAGGVTVKATFAVIHYSEPEPTPTPTPTPTPSTTPVIPSTPATPSNPAPATYSVTVPEKSDGGSVAVEPKNAAEGTSVKLTIKAENGYHLDELTVLDQDGKAVALKDNQDGTYTFTMPAGTVSVETTFVKCTTVSFPDLDPTAWYHEHTDYVISHGLMNGNEKGLFEPNGTVTRAQMVTLLWNLKGKPVVNFYMTYSDVSEETWYAEAIRWATSEGIVSGCGDGSFGPADTITREQMAVMLYNYKKKYGDGGFTGAWMYRLPFEDLDQISDWAFEAVAWCNMKGIITGKGNDLFDPKGQATRAEMAAILTQYLTSNP